MRPRDGQISSDQTDVRCDLSFISRRIKDSSLLRYADSSSQGSEDVLRLTCFSFLYIANHLVPLFGRSVCTLNRDLRQDSVVRLKRGLF